MLKEIREPPAEEAAQKARFGNFEIMNDPEGRPLSLGKGTFGRTYQARHCFLETIVALKIITERYAADAAVRQRFLIEARAVAKLSHPHIARLYDFGEMDGVLHYAMEYCGGGSLADHVGKHGPLSLRQALEVGQQIAGALKCAHAAGFIHRDLKPSNIMLIADEGPLFAKLIDFGLVQASIPGATRSNSVDHSADGARFLGTPLFASPEQLREEPMDVRTDLFSLGMTLWYLLLGGPPESGSSAAIAASRLGAESYAARLPGNLSAPLRDMFIRLLEKDRNKRFGSAAEVFAAFNLCATTLGFRQARDYTDPKAELAEWEDDQLGDQASLQAPEPEPIEVQNVDAELSSEFSIVTRSSEDFTGLNYVAAPNGEPERSVILHVLHPMLLEDAALFKGFRVHIAQLMALDMTEILRPLALKAYSDYVAVTFDKPEGSDLMSILRAGRNVHLIEAAPLLETIADACDRLCAAGLPGVQLAADRIFIEWPDGAEAEGAKSGNQLSKARPKLYPRFLAISEAPELARLNELADASSTMTTDMIGDPARADNMCEHFGTLLYRVVAGRNCHISASLSSQAFVAIPGLSEQSNRLLSLVIAKQIESVSCGQVLREVLSGEGIVSRVQGHPTAGFTARTGSTVSPLAATPPAGQQAPTRFAMPPLVPATDKQATAGRPWKPPTVGSPLTATPAVESPAFVATSVSGKFASKPAVEPGESLQTKVPVIAKRKTDSETKSESSALSPIVTEPARAAKRISGAAQHKKGDRPPAAPQAPFVLPTPPQPAVVSKSAADAVQPKFRVSSLWEDPKFRAVGIGIAALLVVSLSYAAIRKLSPHTVTTKASNVAKAPQVSRPAPVAQPAVNAKAVAVNKPSPPPPRPPVAGHYVGQVRAKQPSGAISMTFDREISIDAGMTSGYLVDYGSDPTKQIQLAESHVDPEGVYTARAVFSSAMGAAHNDENLTVRPGENGLDVSFKGHQTSGAEYTLNGLLHSWTEADQTRYRDLIAAQKQKAVEAAKPMISTPLIPPSNPEVAAQKQRSGEGKTKAEQASRRTALATESAPKAGGGEHQTTRSHASDVAAKPPPAAKPPTRPAAAPKPAGEPRQRPRPEFEGSNPGG